MVAKRREHGMPAGFVSKAQWRYFAARKDLRAKYFEKEAHKAQAAGGGPKIAFHHLPPRKGIRKRV